MLLREYIRRVVKRGGAIAPRVRVVVVAMWHAGWSTKAAANYVRRRREWLARTQRGER